MTTETKLLKAQKEIGAVKKGKENPFFKSKYADINDYLGVIKPVLNKHGLVLVQPITHFKNRQTALSTKILDGETGKVLHESKFALPEIDDPQKMGSAITYYRRYALQSLFALEAEDDDGNRASGNKPRTTQPRKAYPKTTGQQNLANVKKQAQFKHAPGCKGVMEQMPDGEWICNSCNG